MVSTWGPPLPPAPTPHALYLAQHFGHFRHLVNVCWTEKLYDFFVVAVFISFMPLLLCMVCFHSWISPSPPMCWLGTVAVFWSSLVPHLALGNDFMRGVIWHYHGEWWEWEGQEGLGPAPKHVQAVALKADILCNHPSEPSGIFCRPVSLQD